MENKVKRRRINWVKVLHQLDNEEFFKYYFKLQCRLHCGKYVSPNRCAYSTLKHYYSTTSITELVRKLGI